MNLVQKTRQRDDTVDMSGGLNLVQKTSQRYNTVAVSDWYEPRPEDTSKR